MSRLMRYPADMVTDDGWARIHRGHDLDREALRADLIHHHGEPPADHEMHVDEWHLGYAPRVKWCEQYGWPCDNEGDWHAHWYDVKPNDRSAFTVVSYQRVYANAGTYCRQYGYLLNDPSGTATS